MYNNIYKMQQTKYVRITRLCGMLMILLHFAVYTDPSEYLFSYTFQVHEAE